MQDIVNFIDVERNANGSICKQTYHAIDDLSSLFNGPHTTALKIVKLSGKLGNLYYQETPALSYCKLAVYAALYTVYEECVELAIELDKFKNALVQLKDDVLDCEVKAAICDVIDTFNKLLFVCHRLLQAMHVTPFLQLNPLYLHLCLIEVEIKAAKALIKASMEFAPKAYTLYAQGNALEAGAKQIKASLRIAINRENIDAFFRSIHELAHSR